MSDPTQKSVLLELVSKNYTGDSQGYEKIQPVETPSVTTPAVPQDFFFASPIPESIPSSPVVPMEVVVNSAPEPEIQALVVDDPNKKLTKQEEREIRQGEKEYYEALAYIKDTIAPSMMKVDAKQIQIGDTVIRSVFTYAYPDFLEGNWLSPLINWDVKFDMSMFVYPVDSARVMRFLRKRLTQLRAQYAINREK